MKITIKRILSMSLAICMMFAMAITVPVSAEDAAANAVETEDKAAEADNTDDAVENLTDAQYIEWIQGELFAGRSVTLTRNLKIEGFDLVYVPKLTSNRNGTYGIKDGEGAIFYVISENGKEVVFDLNGYSITWDAHDDTLCGYNVALFRVTVEGTQKTAKDKPTNFTIKDSSLKQTGSVTVYGTGTAVYSTFIYTTVTIDGGTWTNYPCKTCKSISHFIYPSHGSVMNITGGTYQQNPATGKDNLLLGWQGSTVEGYQNYLCNYSMTRLNIIGGVFKGFNPEQIRFIDYAGSDKTLINGVVGGFDTIEGENGKSIVDGYDTIKTNDGDYIVVDYVRWIQYQLFNGNSVTLERDIVIDGYDLAMCPSLATNNKLQYNFNHGEGAIFYVCGNGVVFDLNGHSITWNGGHDEFFCNKNVVLFRATVKEKSASANPTNFTIKDSSKDKSGSVTIYGNGTSVYSTFIFTTVTIEGGTWTTHCCDVCNATGVSFYPSHGSVMNITGGTFEQKPAEGFTSQLLGWQGSTDPKVQNAVCHYYKTQFNITGGTFKGCDPEHTRFYDVAGSDKEEINSCPDGYVSVETSDDVYVVKYRITAKSANLLLRDMVQIRYRFELAGEDISEYGLWVFSNEADAATHDPNKAVQKIELKPDVIDGVEGYYGYTAGIPAKNMGDSQFVVGYATLNDGTETKTYYTKTVEYSPEIYASRMVAKSGTKAVTKALCNALMAYGAAAQTYFKHNPDDLMNVGFEPVEFEESVLGESVFSVDTTETNGFTTKSAFLEFEGAITYLIKYAVNDSISDKELYAEYTIYGVKRSVKLEKANDGYYYASIKEIAAKDMGATLTVKPYYTDDNGDKVYGTTLVYSGYEYCRRTLENSENEDMKALARSFAMYVNAAYIALIVEGI